jgi:hypothetical protein
MSEGINVDAEGGERRGIPRQTANHGEEVIHKEEGLPFLELRGLLRGLYINDDGKNVQNTAANKIVRRCNS